jgi:trehalose synthase
MDDYLPIVGEKVLGQIYQKARRLVNKHIVHINSTAHGGGVAEILNNLIVLLNDIGVDSGWRVLIVLRIFSRSRRNFIMDCRAILLI